MGGAAVGPQWDLGLVWLPAHQVAQLSGVFGVLVGRLLLEEGLQTDGLSEEKASELKNVPMEKFGLFCILVSFFKNVYFMSVLLQ